MNRSKSYIIVFVLLMVVGSLSLAIDIAAAQAIDWMRQFGTPFVDHASAVTTDRAGDIYVVGATNGTFSGQIRAGGTQDAYVQKFDPSGKAIWTRQFGSIGDDWARAVAVDHEDNVLVAGQAAEDTPGRSRVSGFGGAFVRKFGAGGDEIWMQHFGIREFSTANGVTVGLAGNVFVVGQIKGALPGQTPSGGSDAFVRAYDKDGAELWTHQFGGEGLDTATAVTIGRDGEIYVVGSSQGELVVPGQPNQTFIDAFVRKFDAAGSELWVRWIGTEKFSGVNVATVDNAGNLYVAGWISGDAFIRKYDADGQDLWTRQFGTHLEDRALGVGVDHAGNPYVVGWTRGAFLGQTGLGPRTNLVRRDAFMRKFDGRGNEIWTRQIGTGSPQSATGITTTGDRIYVVGDTTGSLLGRVNLGVIDAFLLSLSSDAPFDSPLPTGSTSEASPTTSSDTPFPSPLPATAPTEGPPPRGSCGVASPDTHDVPAAWVLTMLFGPGLLLARGSWPIRRIRQRGGSISSLHSRWDSLCSG